MKNIKISDETHALLKKHCHNNHMKLGEYVDHFLKDILALYVDNFEKEHAPKINKK